MKKTILKAGLMFAMLISLFSMAQNFGAKAGLNVANLNGDFDYKSLMGFHAGLYVKVPVNETFTFQPELLYSAQGAKFSDGSFIKLNYINVPLMFKYNLAQKFNLEAGPQLGFLLSATSNYDGPTVDVKDGHSSFDFSLGLGASYYFTDKLNAGLRYNAGFTNVNKNAAYVNKNGVFQLSIGYDFK